MVDGGRIHLDAFVGEPGVVAADHSAVLHEHDARADDAVAVDVRLEGAGKGGPGCWGRGLALGERGQRGERRDEEGAR